MANAEACKNHVGLIRGLLARRERTQTGRQCHKITTSSCLHLQIPVYTCPRCEHVFQLTLQYVDRPTYRSQKLTCVWPFLIQGRNWKLTDYSLPIMGGSPSDARFIYEWHCCEQGFHMGGIATSLVIRCGIEGSHGGACEAIPDPKCTDSDRQSNTVTMI
jgi:hypothetical protein